MQLDLEKVIVLGQRVLVEPWWDEETAGSIVVPTQVTERYPQAGYVLNVGTKCQEDIQPGDYVFMADEGAKLDIVGYTVLELNLKDFGVMFLQEESEPLIREHVEHYRAGGEDKLLYVQDIDQATYSFLCSDVRSYQLGNLGSTTQNLNYLPVYIIWHRQPLDWKQRPYYWVHERDILATMEW